MDEDEATGAPDQASLFPKTVGDKLREAREGLGLTLADIANKTRVPMRHLEAIENNRMEGMASPAYAIGFTKTYARAVGLDDRAIAAELRQSPQMPLSPTTRFEEYEPTDRLIFRSGVLSKHGREIPLERVNDISFNASLFERMIGAGDLVIESLERAKVPA